jgi:uncharacterized RDD family membrane protein YckC
MLREGNVRLRDLNSSNGTFVNDTRVHSETDVIDGDRIVLGETEMRFRSAAPDGSLAATQRVEPPPTGEEEVDAPTLRKGPGLSDLDPPPAPAVEPAPAPQAPARPAVSKVSTGEVLSPIRNLDAPPASAVSPRKTVTPPVPTGSRAAGFWIRAAAMLLDGLWIGALSAVAAALPFLLDVPASLASALLSGAGLASALVVVAGWAKWGTTPGKRLLRLYVIPVGGSPGRGAGIGFGKALLRYLGYFPSLALLGMGFVLVAFSREKRALHDLIAGTTVVRR